MEGAADLQLLPLVSPSNLFRNLLKIRSQSRGPSNLQVQLGSDPFSLSVSDLLKLLLGPGLHRTSLDLCCQTGSDLQTNTEGNI